MNGNKECFNRIRETVRINEREVASRYNKAKKYFLKTYKLYNQYLDYEKYIMKRYLEYIDTNDHGRKDMIIEDAVQRYEKIKYILKSLNIGLVVGDNDKDTTLNSIRDYVRSHDEEVFKKYEKALDNRDKAFKSFIKYLNYEKTDDNDRNKAFEVSDKCLEYEKADDDYNRISRLYDQYSDIEIDILRKYLEYINTSDDDRKAKLNEEIISAYPKIKNILKSLEIE